MAGSMKTLVECVVGMYSHVQGRAILHVMGNIATMHRQTEPPVISILNGIIL